MAKKRKIKEVVSMVVEQPKTTWEKTKDWFYHSETIALSYIATASGAITGVVGVFDLSPLWSMFQTGTEFTNKQLTWMGVGIVGAGLAAYVARVRGTKEVSGRLLPASEQ